MISACNAASSSSQPIFRRAAAVFERASAIETVTVSAEEDSLRADSATPRRIRSGAAVRKASVDIDYWIGASRDDLGIS